MDERNRSHKVRLTEQYGFAYAVGGDRPNYRLFVHSYLVILGRELLPAPYSRLDMLV